MKERNYVGYILLDNKIKKVPFRTSDNPVEYLWGKYGMSVYVERIDGIVDETSNETVAPSVAK